MDGNNSNQIVCALYGRGGTGKSTYLVYQARVAAELYKKKVILIDLDSNATLNGYTSTIGTKTSLDILRSGTPVKDVKQLLKANLHYIPGPDGTGGLAKLVAKDIRTNFPSIINEADYIFINNRAEPEGIYNETIFKNFVNVPFLWYDPFQLDENKSSKGNTISLISELKKIVNVEKESAILEIFKKLNGKPIEDKIKLSIIAGIKTYTKEISYVSLEEVLTKSPTKEYPLEQILTQPVSKLKIDNQNITTKITHEEYLKLIINNTYNVVRHKISQQDYKNTLKQIGLTPEFTNENSITKGQIKSVKADYGTDLSNILESEKDSINKLVEIYRKNSKNLGLIVNRINEKSNNFNGILRELVKNINLIVEYHGRLQLGKTNFLPLPTYIPKLDNFETDILYKPFEEEYLNLFWTIKEILENSKVFAFSKELPQHNSLKFKDLMFDRFKKTVTPEIEFKRPKKTIILNPNLEIKRVTLEKKKGLIERFFEMFKKAAI